MERHRAQTRLRNRLNEALKNGPQTVPELAQATGIPTHEVFWQLVCMKKYGPLVEGENRAGYCTYSLKKEDENK